MSQELGEDDDGEYEFDEDDESTHSPMRTGIDNDRGSPIPQVKRKRSPSRDASPANPARIEKEKHRPQKSVVGDHDAVTPPANPRVTATKKTATTTGRLILLLAFQEVGEKLLGLNGNGNGVVGEAEEAVEAVAEEDTRLLNPLLRSFFRSPRRQESSAAFAPPCHNPQVSDDTAEDPSAQWFCASCEGTDRAKEISMRNGSTVSASQSPTPPIVARGRGRPPKVPKLNVGSLARPVASPESPVEVDRCLVCTQVIVSTSPSNATTESTDHLHEHLDEQSTQVAHPVNAALSVDALVDRGLDTSARRDRTQEFYGLNNLYHGGQSMEEGRRRTPDNDSRSGEGKLLGPQSLQEMVDVLIGKMCVPCGNQFRKMYAYLLGEPQHVLATLVLQSAIRHHEIADLLRDRDTPLQVRNLLAFSSRPKPKGPVTVVQQGPPAWTVPYAEQPKQTGDVSRESTPMTPASGKASEGTPALGGASARKMSVYEDMIVWALDKLRDPQGSQRKAIFECIQDNFRDVPENFRTTVTNALKKGTDAGRFKKLSLGRYALNIDLPSDYANPHRGGIAPPSAEKPAKETKSHDGVQMNIGGYGNNVQEVERGTDRNGQGWHASSVGAQLHGTGDDRAVPLYGGDRASQFHGGAEDRFAQFPCAGGNGALQERSHMGGNRVKQRYGAGADRAGHLQGPGGEGTGQLYDVRAREEGARQFHGTSEARVGQTAGGGGTGQFYGGRPGGESARQPHGASPNPMSGPTEHRSPRPEAMVHTFAHQQSWHASNQVPYPYRSPHPQPTSAFEMSRVAPQTTRDNLRGKTGIGFPPATGHPGPYTTPPPHMYPRQYGMPPPQNNGMYAPHTTGGISLPPMTMHPTPQHGVPSPTLPFPSVGEGKYGGEMPFTGWHGRTSAGEGGYRSLPNSRYHGIGSVHDGGANQDSTTSESQAAEGLGMSQERPAAGM
ncbi:hypothetical protein HK104_004604 [Borealophlyctis nickersoniae]|nr:hypothetical protein HK104_004604 [Borealophlyctis nickersoniae]